MIASVGVPRSFSERGLPTLVIFPKAWVPALSGLAGTLRGVTIELVLQRQAGVIGRTQALAEGMSSAAIGRRLSGGQWVRVHPRVYLAADHALTGEARLRAAYLWAGDGATVSGVAAGWWHGLWADMAGQVEITIPHRQRLAARPGIRVRRCDLQAADRVEVNGVWVTAAPLTALEAALRLGAKGSQLLDRALQRRVAVPDLYAAYCRGLGRPGWGVAAGLLRAAGDRAASEAERLMITLLRGAGLTGWLRGYRVGGYELDFAFPAKRIAIEVDGWAWHSDAKRFGVDRQRQNALVLAGWTVLRFTWHDLANRADSVIAQVRRAAAA